VSLIAVFETDLHIQLVFGADCRNLNLGFLKLLERWLVIWNLCASRL